WDLWHKNAGGFGIHIYTSLFCFCDSLRPFPRVSRNCLDKRSQESIPAVVGSPELLPLSHPSFDRRRLSGAVRKTPSPGSDGNRSDKIRSRHSVVFCSRCPLEKISRAALPCAEIEIRRSGKANTSKR